MNIIILLCILIGATKFHTACTTVLCAQICLSEFSLIMCELNEKLKLLYGVREGPICFEFSAPLVIHAANAIRNTTKSKKK